MKPRLSAKHCLLDSHCALGNLHRLSKRALLGWIQFGFLGLVGLLATVGSALAQEIAEQRKPWTQANDTTVDGSGKVATSFRIWYNRSYSTKQPSLLTADIFRPDNDQRLPGILLIHGGAWIAGDKIMDSMHAKKIAARGYVVMSINYRLAPKYKFPAQIDDCFTAFEWFIDHADEVGVDLDHMGAWGYSAGGHLASLMATNPREGIRRLDVCVAGGAPCDMRLLKVDENILAKLLGGTRSQVPKIYEQASPAFHVSSDDPPMFLFHGTGDQLVPHSMSDHMDRVLTDAGVEHEYLVVDRKTHLMTFADMDVLNASIDFLDAHLKK